MADHFAGRENPIRSSSFRKPGSTGSGSTGLVGEGRDREPRGGTRPRSRVSRRRRRAKTDKIDGEGLLRALLAFKRGEPRVCSMVRVPTPPGTRIAAGFVSRAPDADPPSGYGMVNRIKGLLFSQGIGDYEPLRRDRRRALEAARTGDGRALGANMKAQIGRELDRLELLLGQIAAIEAERDAMLARQAEAEAVQGAQGAPARVQKPGRGNRARGRGGPGRPEADRAERPGRGNRGHALDGGVLPLVSTIAGSSPLSAVIGEERRGRERLDRSRRPSSAPHTSAFSGRKRRDFNKAKKLSERKFLTLSERYYV